MVKDWKEYKNNRKAIRQRKIINVSIVCLYAILCLSGCGNKPTNEEIITELVLNNEEILRQEIEDAGEDGEIFGIDGVEDVSDKRNDDGKGIISYECGAEGILTSSRQYGFYYSTEDIPSKNALPWTGEGDDWTEVPQEKEESWYYKGYGDNWYYTSKICDNFYYFSAGN